jgi:hypothetical protein
MDMDHASWADETECKHKAKPGQIRYPAGLCSAPIHRSSAALPVWLPLWLEQATAKQDNFGCIARSEVGQAAPEFTPAMAMTKEEERELREQLARLLQEHRDLDAAISALQEAPGSDLLQVQRLKKRKLSLKDRISFIEDQLTPDIIA